MTINLGDKVKDKVSGFSGIVVCRVEWLYGCIRIGVQSDKIDKDGKPLEVQHFDEPQLVVVKAGVVTRDSPEKAARRYGPRPDEKQNKSTPSRR